MVNQLKQALLRKYAAKVVAGGAVAMATLTNLAHAALPTEVTTAITTAGQDLSAAALAIIVAMVAVWGLRKLGQKMGWW